MIEFLTNLFDTHKGILTVLLIVGVFATIGWACDEWEKLKKKR